MYSNERRYPVGIQTFSEIVNGGYVYVDKTDLVWKMARQSKYVFLSRPRRFGKSLLASTLKSYFEGRSDLFKGLKIMQYEREWKEYPVIHLDMSTCKNQQSAEALQRRIMLMLEEYTKLYGKHELEETPGAILQGIIRRCYEKTGRQAAVIIDEYDAPLLDVLHRENELQEFRRVMQEFFQPLKSSDPYIRFCLLMGITRLSQMNIFSTLNNLENVSTDNRYASICGITEEELFTTLLPDIQLVADACESTVDEMKRLLKMQYDGYHFSSASPDIYNPYSLINALSSGRISNYWFETGTPSFLIQMMKKFRFNITSMEEIESTEYAINRPTEAMTTVVPLLYQSGYLTIKHYDRESLLYTLGIPNQEVRVGYADGLLPTYSGLEGEDVQSGFAIKFWRALKKHDIELALREMQTYLAAIPYVEGFKRKLQEAATREGFYEYTLYLIFSMLNVYVRTQVKCSGGRTDVVVSMPDTTYVLELKINGTACEALEQINSKGYALPFNSEGRKVVKAGIRFNTESMTIEDWAIESEQGDFIKKY